VFSPHPIDRLGKAVSLDREACAVNWLSLIPYVDVRCIMFESSRFNARSLWMQ